MYHKLAVSYRNLMNKMNYWRSVCRPQMQYRHAPSLTKKQSKSRNNNWPEMCLFFRFPFLRGKKWIRVRTFPPVSQLVHVSFCRNIAVDWLLENKTQVVSQVAYLCHDNVIMGSVTLSAFCTSCPSFVFYYYFNGELQTDGKDGINDMLSHTNQTQTKTLMPDYNVSMFGS